MPPSLSNRPREKFLYRFGDLQLEGTHREAGGDDLVAVGVQDLYVAFAAERGDAGERAHSLAASVRLLRLLPPLLLGLTALRVGGRGGV